nr:lanthionine synthetase LanC family protein [uncultured Faecalibacillus sp.]
MEIERILESIVLELKSNMANGRYKVKIDSILVCYFYSLYRNDLKFFEDGKTELEQLLSKINLQKIPMGTVYGYILLIYLIDAYEINMEIKDDMIDRIKYFCLKVVREDYKKTINMISGIYDVLNGISGILLYFMQLDDLTKHQDFIEEVTAWLIYKVNNDAEGLQAFFIKNDFIINPYIKKLYKEGYIDCGLSHGLIGIGVVLSKVYKKNILKFECKNAIEKIKNIYIKYCRSYETGMFPEVIEVNNNIKIPHYSQRVSWCYGALGILRSLNIIAKNIEDKTLDKFVNENLEYLYSIDINRYLLKCPTFCHGYSGLYLITYLFSKYIDNNQKLFQLKIEESKKIIWSMGNEKNKYYFFTNDIDDSNKKDEELIDTNYLDGITSIIISYISTKIDLEKNFYLKFLALI